MSSVVCDTARPRHATQGSAGLSAALAVAVTATLMSGCAALRHRGPARQQTVKIESIPDSARVFLSDTLIGVTPTTHQFDPHRDQIVTLTLRKPGHPPTSYSMAASVPWSSFLGSSLLGCCLCGPIGAVAGPAADEEAGAGTFPGRVVIRLKTWEERVGEVARAANGSTDTDEAERALELLAGVTAEDSCAIPRLIQEFPKLTFTRTFTAYPTEGMTGLVVNPTGANVFLAAYVDKLQARFGECVEVGSSVIDEPRFESNPLAPGGKIRVQDYGVSYTVRIGEYALKRITGQDLGDSRAEWERWWNENKARYGY